MLARGGGAESRSECRWPNNDALEGDASLLAAAALSSADSLHPCVPLLVCPFLCAPCVCASCPCALCALCLGCECVRATGFLPVEHASVCELQCPGLMCRKRVHMASRRGYSG